MRILSTMKQVSAIALLSLLATVSLTPNTAKAAATGRVIVRFQADTPAADAQALHKGMGARVIKRLPALHAEVVEVPGRSGQDAAAAYSRNLRVKFAEVDRLVPPDQVPNDPMLGSQWHHTKVETQAAWNAGATGAQVRIGICDTGVNVAHPDLNVLGYLALNTVDGSMDVTDNYGHGTETAGTAAARGNNGAGVAGAAWQAQIIPVKISNNADGTAQYSDAAECIRYAADNGARVINLSYGMAGSQIIDEAAWYAESKGAVTVVSAGNENLDPGYVDWPSFLAVSATDQNDARASFSSYGPYVDLAAPGVSIWTTASTGGYRTASGTSFSAPLTAGVLAQMFGVYPALTVAQAKQIVTSTTDDLGDPGEDIYFGSGRLNARKAVEAVLAYNHPAQLTVSSPAEGAIFRPGDPITFTATATDMEQGDVTEQINWLFLNDSTIHYGGTFTRTDLQVGGHTVNVFVRDAGGASTEQTLHFEVYDDSVPPAGTVAINNGAAITNKAAVTLNLSASDVGSRVADMRFSHDALTWTDWEPYAATRAWTLPAGDGVQRVHAQFRDAVGNLSETATDTIVVDATGPVGTVLINGGAAATLPGEVTLTLSATDDPSGVTQMRFSNSMTSWSAWEPYATTKTYTVPRLEGQQPVNVQFMDGLGNVSVTYSDTIYVDLLGPTGSISINSSASYTNSATVTLTLSADDYAEGTGIGGMRFSEDGQTWTDWESYATTRVYTMAAAEGDRKVYVQYKDGVEQLSGTYWDNITLDLTAPVPGSITIASGAEITRSLRNYVSVSATDALTGVWDMRFSTDNATWSAWGSYGSGTYYDLPAGEGLRTVYAQFRDRAGNLSESISDTITVDTVVPVVSATSVPEGAVVPALTTYVIYMSDATSGVDEVNTRLVVTRNTGVLYSGSSYTRDNSVDGQITITFAAPADGTYQFEVQPKDMAGNSGITRYLTVVADATAPTINYITPSNNSTVDPFTTLSFTMYDGTGTSGVDEAGTEVTATLDGAPFTGFTRDDSVADKVTITITTQADGVYVFSVKPRDNAGNVAAPTTITITDKAPPLVAPANLTATVSGTSVQLNWTDQSNRETQFVVERAVKNKWGQVGTFSVIGTVPAPDPSGVGGTVTFTNSGLVANTYVYRVKAATATESSPYSAQVEARIGK